MSAPVFAVGLPRSGSTLLSRVLNESPDILSVNDLYYLQAVLERGLPEGPLDQETAGQLLDMMLDLIVIRGSTNSAFIGQFTFTPAQSAALREEVLGIARAEGLDWAGLMDAALTRVAASAGKTRWADKTPQNFLHMDLLRRTFPDARFLFLLRSPHATLASFKFASGSGHDPRRYHPVTYALYWRTAARTLDAERGKADVLPLRFEDLTGDTEAVCERMGAFLGTVIPAPDLGRVGANSSFRGGRKEVSPTEAWIVDRICGERMRAEGYEPSGERPRLADLPLLLRLTCTFTVFQARRLFFSRNGRKRIIAMARRTLGLDR
ncbi:MAG: sulfotransferase [Desulfovibrionaceae bacterium]